VLTIWKYSCPVADRFHIPLPDGARFVHMDVQYETAVMWWLVDPEAEPTQTTFRSFGTGHEIPDSMRDGYLGSYQLHGGAFVGHIFIERKDIYEEAHANSRRAQEPHGAGVP
jgi:hypothetical protein